MSQEKVDFLANSRGQPHHAWRHPGPIEFVVEVDRDAGVRDLGQRGGWCEESIRRDLLVTGAPLLAGQRPDRRGDYLSISLSNRIVDYDARPSAGCRSMYCVKSAGVSAGTGTDDAPGAAGVVRSREMPAERRCRRKGFLGPAGELFDAHRVATGNCSSVIEFQTMDPDRSKLQREISSRSSWVRIPTSTVGWCGRTRRGRDPTSQAETSTSSTYTRACHPR
jgi:hypothetical protein